MHGEICVRTTLGDCARFVSGGTPSKSEPSYWGGEIPWVSAKDMKSFYLDNAEDHITSVAIQHGTRLAKPGSILLLVRGMTLHNDVPICLVRQPMAFNQDVKALIARDGVNPRFLAYWLLGHKHQLLSAVDFAGHGTGRLNTDTLKALPLQLPSEKEQGAIADAITAIDDKIELNRRMNETLESIARAIFKSWFADFDPVRAKAEGRQPVGMNRDIAALFPSKLVKSGAFVIPDGWEMRSLDTIAHFLNGLALQKFPPTGTGDLPVIKIAELRRGDTEGSDLAGTHVPPEYIVQDGDVLFSWSGSLEVVIWCGGKGALNQHLFKVTSSSYPKWFYFYWIKEHLPDFQAIAAGKATTMGHIQRRHLSEALVVVSPEPILKAAHALVAPLIDRVVANNLESRTLRLLRDTLLPKLLSGEVRVKPAERIMEVAL